MHFSKLYIQQNFVPDVVADQFGRKVIGVEVSLNEGQSLDEAKETAQNYIKEYIEKNTVYHSPQFISESLPPEPAVLPSIQKEKIEPDFDIVVEEIEKCQTLDELKGWQFLSVGNKNATKAFKEKLIELQS
jgi:hypothetical protein